MKTQPYLLISGSLFALVGVAHLLRIVNGWPVTAGPWPIPMWVSWIGTLIPAGLSTWAFALIRRHA